MFQKGQSGNPAGPAKGTRHKITMLAEKLMQDPDEASFCFDFGAIQL